MVPGCHIGLAAEFVVPVGTHNLDNFGQSTVGSSFLSQFSYLIGSKSQRISMKPESDFNKKGSSCFGNYFLFYMTSYEKLSRVIF